MQKRITRAIDVTTRLLFLCFLSQLFIPAVTAQNRDATQSDVYYYLIEDIDSGTVVRRGTTTKSGLPASSLILAPNKRYREWLLEVDTLRVGFVEFETPDSGNPFRIPKIGLLPPMTPDSDSDGLHDDAEFIIGTKPTEPDTDGDGVQDLAETQQGRDPLDGLHARTGILDSIDTPGEAVEVYAFDDSPSWSTLSMVYQSSISSTE